MKNHPGKYLVLFIISLLITFVTPCFCQEQRLTDHNSIGWFAFTGSFKIHPKIILHTEYQWRREGGIKNWQQSLIRTGVNFALRKEVSLNAGYAFAETFPYGDYPNATVFPEHRIFEQVVLKNPIGKAELSHRLTLEQRFVGKVLLINEQRDIDWIFLNRVRYRFRTEIPLYKKALSIILMDEVFIGWGKNIGTNIFDQNRSAVLIGYKISNSLKIEGGYLNQILQQGKRVNDKSVFQHNNGFVLATYLSVDLIK